jgi:pimeloyl-ACP methyl ester carboxylesterase
VLHDYCFHALQPEPQGDGYVLACPPLVEATLYYSGMAPDADIYPLLSQIHVPTWVIRAGSPQQPSSFDMRASPTVPNLARYFPHGRDEHLPGYTHFLPMENPMLVAARIEALVAQIEKKEPG